MKNTLIAICLTEHDFNKFSSTIFQSIKNFEVGFNNDLDVFFRIQTKKNIEDFDLNQLKSFSYSLTNYFSVSDARNYCIDYALSLNYKNIYFFDASIYMPPESAAFLYKCQFSSTGYIPRLEYSFSEPHGTNLKKNYTVKKIYPISNPFVWTFLFPVSLLSTRFDENLGPGEKTILKSGEDVLFLYDVLCGRRVLQSRNDYVFHPPRGGDNTKRLIYAEGQGCLYKRLIFHKPHPFLFFYFFLFIINTFFLAITLRKNGPKILYYRLKGLLCKS